MRSMSDLGLPERQMTGRVEPPKGMLAIWISFSASIGIDWKIGTQPALQVLEYIEY